jgi:hypothetical protein
MPICFSRLVIPLLALTPWSSASLFSLRKPRRLLLRPLRILIRRSANSLRLAATVLAAKDNMKKYEKEYQKNLDVSLLLKLYDAKMIEPFVLISAPDRDIALNDYVPYREQHRDQLEAYLSQFVVPPTPASKN